MEKEKVLEMAKIDMKEIVEEIKLENLVEVKEKFLNYFSFLESLLTLEKTNYKTSFNELKKTKEDIVENQKKEEKLKEEKIFTFERKLKGGFLPEIGVYVPEGVIRKMRIETGDKLKIREIQNEEAEDKKYFFELVEKTEQKFEDERVEIEYCLVEKDGSILVVNRSLTNGGVDIKIGETHHTFLVRDKDIRELGLQEGDIVDIAYNKNSPHIYKIVWKHIFEYEESSIPQISGYYKVKEKNEHKLEGKEKNIFKNKNILVVGCEPRKRVFKEQIENRGGKFLWAEGTETKEIFHSLVKKADIVILLIRFMRHRASLMAVELCKKENIPFEVVDTLGVKTIIETTYTGLNEQTGA